MRESAKKLKEEFTNKKYRHAYAEEFLNALIATQIKVLREQREWSQAELATQYGKDKTYQPAISRLEDVNYSSWNIKTLRRLARAFDLILLVKFESFGTLVREMDGLGRTALERPKSIDEDPEFSEAEVLTQTVVLGAETSISTATVETYPADTTWEIERQLMLADSSIWMTGARMGFRASQSRA